MDTQSTVKAQRQQEAGRILARLREGLPSILARYPVDAAYVYGSVARGTMTPLSDVDIALLLTAPLPPYERLQMELTIGCPALRVGSSASYRLRGGNTQAIFRFRSRGPSLERRFPAASS